MPEEKDPFEPDMWRGPYVPKKNLFPKSESPFVAVTAEVIEEAVRKVVKEEMESFTSRIEQAIRTAHMTQYVYDMDFAISSNLSAEEVEKRIRSILEKDRATMVTQITRMLNGGM